MKIIVVILGFVLLVSGCSALQTDDLVGTYKDNNPFGISTLILKKDGTYSQALTTKASKKKYISSGKWKFDGSDNQIYIDNALAYNDLISPAQVERIGTNYHVEKIVPEGQPQIVVNADRGIAFAKVN